MLAAGAQDRPDPRVPLPAHERTASLRDASIDHRGANSTLGGIVRRLNGWVEQESEDRIAMLDQPPGQRSGLRAFAGGAALGQAQHTIFDPQHDAVEPFFGNLLPQMPEVKQSFEIDQQTFAKPLVALPGQRGEELDVSNQMGQAKLLETAGVLDV